MSSGRKWRGHARIMVGIDHLAVLAHGHLLVELVAFAQRVAHEGGPKGIFQAHPAETFSGAEQDILQRAGFRFQVPVFHEGCSAPLNTGTEGDLFAGGHWRLLIGMHRD